MFRSFLGSKPLSINGCALYTCLENANIHKALEELRILGLENTDICAKGKVTVPGQDEKKARRKSFRRLQQDFKQGIH